jgi:hypothetical protein
MGSFFETVKVFIVLEDSEAVCAYLDLVPCDMLSRPWWSFGVLEDITVLNEAENGTDQLLGISI